MNKTILMIILFVEVFVFSFLQTAQAWNYPDDTGYQEIPTVGTVELHDYYNAKKGIIIDVRSSVEYNTAHIKNSINILLSKKNFINILKVKTKNNPEGPFFFYCNGGSCLKAPDAVKKAMEAGFKECFAYYEGVPGWAEAYPEETVLRGRSVSADNKLIPKKDFKAKCIGFDEFKQKIAGDGKAIVIDVRDLVQKSGKLPGISKKVLSIPLDKFIPNFVQKKQHLNKTLYIFDQVGKQVQALQYDLIENGYENYWFLKKGATKVLGKQKYRK